jgi:hypothetical protein
MKLLLRALLCCIERYPSSGLVLVTVVDEALKMHSLESTPTHRISMPLNLWLRILQALVDVWVYVSNLRP